MIPFICKYCGKDTSEVDYDYLNGYDHLSCALEAENKSNEFDHCVLCGVETVYNKTPRLTQVFFVKEISASVKAPLVRMNEYKVTL